MKSSSSFFKIQENPGSFWGTYLDLVRNTVIPYQWEALNDRIPEAQPSHAIENFRIAAGLSTGEYVGMVFQDSDVGKWIEAVAYSLQTHPDPALEALVDETVEIMHKAQAPDGYLNTYFTLKEPGRRWTNLWECHELYSAGHLLEGAVAYYQATGKRRFLDMMIRYVDLIGRTFGTGPGQIRGYDGHEEIELALLRLYDVTQDQAHLDLARFFLEERGREPFFFHQQWEELGHVSHWSKTATGKPWLEYHQSHCPVCDQTEATGHAVRAVYLYAAMADLAGRIQDEKLSRACETLWQNITHKQMYITGGIGSTHHGEAFSFNYDLPNDTIYAETCASIGLIFFAQNMLKNSPHAGFADVIEQALYNTVLSSMALDGKHFFYVNPLEVWPEASARNPGKHHVKAERQAWFGCACCPPNLARLLMSLGHYVSRHDGKTLWIDQYVPGTLDMAGYTDTQLELVTQYPLDAKITLRFHGQVPKDLDLALRIPGWCDSFVLQSGGITLNLQPREDGYVHVPGSWIQNHELCLDLDMPVRIMEANPQVRSDAGNVCLCRGPLVYCLEEADHGPNLSALGLETESPFTVEAAPDLPAGTLLIRAQGLRLEDENWDGKLYRPIDSTQGKAKPVSLTAVPYHLWGNRTKGEMSVWIRRL